MPEGGSGGGVTETTEVDLKKRGDYSEVRVCGLAPSVTRGANLKRG